jgi:hypothetical protein
VDGKTLEDTYTRILPPEQKYSEQFLPFSSDINLENLAFMDSFQATSVTMSTGPQVCSVSGDLRKYSILPKVFS